MWRQRRGLYVGLMATWVLPAVLVASGPRSESVGFGFTRITPWQYLLMQSKVVLHYGRLILWPSPLVVDYYDWPISKSLLDVWPQALALVGLLGATVWGLVRRFWLALIGAWWFCILAPSSSIVPIVSEVAAERRVYLASAAVVVALVVVGWRVCRRLPLLVQRRGIISISLVALLTGILGTLTMARNLDYRTEVIIWQDAVTKRPHNPRAHNNLGFALWKQGKIDEASVHFTLAIELEPTYGDAYNNLGNVLKRKGRLAQAEHAYRNALTFEPKSGAAHNNLANILLDQGRLEEALGHYRQAVQLRPLLAEPHKNLALALSKQGKAEEAIAEYRLAIQLGLRDPSVYNAFGALLAQQGQLEEATLQFQEALRLDPQHDKAQRNLDTALHLQRKH